MSFSLKRGVDFNRTSQRFILSTAVDKNRHRNSLRIEQTRVVDGSIPFLRDAESTGSTVPLNRHKSPRKLTRMPITVQHDREQGFHNKVEPISQKNEERHFCQRVVFEQIVRK